MTAPAEAERPDVRHNCYYQAVEQHTEFASSDVPAIVEPTGVSGGFVTHRVTTYSELIEGVNRVASGLALLGVGRGDRVLLMVPPSLELYQAILAVLKLGAVCLFIDPADGLGNLNRSAESMHPKVFIGVPRAHALRLLSSAVRRIPIVVSTRPLPLGLARTWDDLLTTGAPEHPTAPVLAEDPVMISFTSGSSGSPKGVCRSHRDLRAIFAMLCDHEAKRQHGVNFCAFPVLPLDDLSWGRTSLLPKHPAGKLASADPFELADQIWQFPPILMSAPPGMIRLLVNHARRTGARFPSIRDIFTGGGPVGIDLVRDVAAVMPDARLHILYGSTEAEPVSMIDAPEVLEETAAMTEDGAGMCVGRTGPEIRLAVVAPSDGPLEAIVPISGIGEIAVTGPHVNRYYYGDPEMTRLHKVADAATGKTWHRMGDMGYLDDRGRLWLVGRWANRVETSSGTLYTAQVEPVFDALPGVRKTALLGADGDAVLLVDVDPAVRDRRAVLGQVREQILARGLPIRLVLETGAIPYDARIGAKLQYSELAKRHERAIKFGMK